MRLVTGLFPCPEIKVHCTRLSAACSQTAVSAQAMRALVIRSEDSARVNKPVVTGLPRHCAVLIPAYPAPNLVWPPRVRRGMREVVGRVGDAVRAEILRSEGHLEDIKRLWRGSDTRKVQRCTQSQA